MEGPTWQMQNVNKAEKHTPKVDAAWYHQAPRFGEGFAADLAVFENPITTGRLITYVVHNLL